MLGLKLLEPLVGIRRRVRRSSEQAEVGRSLEVGVLRLFQDARHRPPRVGLELHAARLDRGTVAENGFRVGAGLAVHHGNRHDSIRVG